VTSAQANYDKMTKGGTALDVASAQESLKQAQASYDKLVAPPTASDIAAAEASIASAQASYDKAAQGGTANDLTQAQASVDQANATLTDLQNGPRSEDIAVSMASVKQSEASLEVNRLKLKNATLAAPFSGVVNAVNIIPGQSLTGSENAVELVDDSSYHVDLYIGEADIAKVKLSNEVNLTFDAIAGTTVQGKVTFVASKSTVSSNVVTYLTTVTLDKASAAAVRAGMTANATVVYEAKTNALLVPNKAIRSQSGQRIVTVRSGGQNHELVVTTGLNDGTNTEIASIVSGGDLADGDSVVLNTTATTTTTTTRGGGGLGGLR